MIDKIFSGIFDTQTTEVIDVSQFLILVLCSLAVGLILAASYMYRNHYTKGFVATIAMLPAVVCVVIMMVNGNIGTGVAVMGAFNLVRFRSAPGSAREICIIFLAMAAGLVMGMGYIGYSFLCTGILGIVSAAYNYTGLGKGKKNSAARILHITVPEDLNYTGVIEDVLVNYAKEWELTNIKTTNMGSLFKLTYEIVMLDRTKEKEMIDKLRCRNGNLEIALSSWESAAML